MRIVTEKQWPVAIARIDQCISRIEKRCLSGAVPLKARVARCGDPVPFAGRLALAYAPIREGEHWGGTWDSAWFHIVGQVPPEWAGSHVVAHLEFNGEALIFGADGTPLQALTNGSVYDLEHGGSARSLYTVQACAQGGESVALWVEAAANSLTGVKRPPDPERGAKDRHGAYTGVLNTMRLKRFDDALWRLWLDMDVLHNLLKALPQTLPRATRLLRGLMAAADRFADDPANAQAARAELQPLLEQPAYASALTAAAVGHAHIDVAYLWPMRDGARKAARTFASQLALLETYPDYVFGASQPQLYAFVKAEHPALFEKIRAAVRAGRWELQGAMWVEADCNLIGGESMVRQLVHGKQFFRDTFGVDVRNLWLPDVFGYSAALPQLLKRAGVPFFLTQKLSWNQYNKFPYTSFRWRGLDGSEVLTHFPPEDNYNSRLSPERLRFAERNFAEKDILDAFLVLFGIGDGGGGPRPDHVERGRRQANLEGVPKVRFSRADAFFDRLAEQAESLPVWSGELYLELHRGTLTTQARTKRGNRKLEQALRETEYLCALWALDRYPAAELDRIWKRLMTNQFHDIIPGSSIHWVYEEAERDYREGLACCAELREQAAETAFARDAAALTLISSLNTPTNEVVPLPEGWNGACVEATGAELPAQREPDGRVVVRVELPPQAVVTLKPTAGAVAASTAETPRILENALVRYTFDGDGRLVNAWDKTAKRAILADGAAGNVLALYEDRPCKYDAWDIELYYEHQLLETARGVAVASLGAGPVRQGLAFELAIGRSRLVQHVYLRADSKRLDFETTADWDECHRMLRVAFPVAVASDRATFEIQYGFVERNTHRNVSWDLARFEVAAQRYADLSDPRYGVALLNDCKYGYKVHENVLDLNLLRSPTHPDPDADLGRHAWTYSLLPHEGALIDSNVLAEAEALNQPPIRLEGFRANPAAVAPVRVEGKGVCLAALKRAENAPCRVLRVVETRGCATQACIHIPQGDVLVETDLMEWNDKAPMEGPCVRVPLEPFAVRTFKIEPRPNA